MTLAAHDTGNDVPLDARARIVRAVSQRREDQELRSAPLDLRTTETNRRRGLVVDEGMRSESIGMSVRQDREGSELCVLAPLAP